MNHDLFIVYAPNACTLISLNWTHYLQIVEIPYGTNKTINYNYIKLLYIIFFICIFITAEVPEVHINLDRKAFKFCFGQSEL